MCKVPPPCFLVWERFRGSNFSFDLLQVHWPRMSLKTWKVHSSENITRFQKLLSFFEYCFAKFSLWILWRRVRKGFLIFFLAKNPCRFITLRTHSALISFFCSSLRRFAISEALCSLDLRRFRTINLSSLSVKVRGLPVFFFLCHITCLHILSHNPNRSASA